MKDRDVVLGEWYSFKSEDKTLIGNVVSKHMNFVVFSVRTNTGFAEVRAMYVHIIKKSPINSLAKADYIDFLLDIKDYESLKEYCKET